MCHIFCSQNFFPKMFVSNTFVLEEKLLFEVLFVLEKDY